jgi:hypothetical protein
VGNSAQFSKDPQATLDYQIDWTAWLASTDYIATSTWTTPTGLTAVSNMTTTTTTTIWLAGGTAGGRYEVVNTITTAAGRIDERTLTIIVTDR